MSDELKSTRQRDFVNDETNHPLMTLNAL